jgi:hypothetical protein
MNQNKWKGILVVLAYSLLLFLPHPLLGGVFKKTDLYHCSFCRKFIVILAFRKFASENQQSIIDNIFRGSLLLVCFGICDAILFVSSIGVP